MPSGITSDIYDGKDVSLRDYLMAVGRQCGFAIMQRDDDPSEPVKGGLTPYTSYYDERSVEARALKMRLSTMKVEQAADEALNEYREAMRSWKASVKRDANLRKRYLRMRAAVEAWPGVPGLLRVKEMALEQLNQSIRFDCPVEPAARWKPRLLSGEEWLAEKRARAERDIAYHAKERYREHERTDDRNAAIEVFLGSLPDAS